MKKLPYIVIIRANSVKLEKKVSEKIAEGYKPFGNLSVVDERGAIYLCQPMVLTARKENKHVPNS
jgi:hypothetical protein